MSLISLLKKLPIDVGQAEHRYDSAGKRIAFSHVPNTQGGQALDIGCRDGYWSKQLEGKGYSVFSLDIDPQYEKAIPHNAEEGLPFPDNSFDVVWCSEVIEHLYTPRQLLNDIDRVLTSNGIAVLTTPNSNWWLYWVVRLWGWTPQKLQNDDHKQFFSKRDIQTLAPEYQLIGYFPYALVFFPIRLFIGSLSPTFVLVHRRSLSL